MRICMEFHLISGLKMNVDKNKVVKLKCPDLNIIWTDEFTSPGIDYDTLIWCILLNYTKNPKY